MDSNLTVLTGTSSDRASAEDFNRTGRLFFGTRKIIDRLPQYSRRSFLVYSPVSAIGMTTNCEIWRRILHTVLVKWIGAIWR